MRVYAAHMPDDLDPDSPVPLYRQLAERLRERIAEEGLTRLPSQRTLEQEYGVSRPTVEDALKILKDSGEVFVSKGKGTFVRRADLWAPRREPARRAQDASGRIVIRPERTGCVPLASPSMEEDDEPGRIPLRNSEWRYIQVADDLEKRIRSGEFPYDSTLPRRDVIASEYGVGEMTVRRALGVLAGRGLVRPMPAVGTVVIWPGHEQGTP
jgi:DNA-binding GntR family transcriptional regulator